MNISSGRLENTNGRCQLRLFITSKNKLQISI
jgi:hypothetical protein